MAEALTARGIRVTQVEMLVGRLGSETAKRVDTYSVRAVSEPDRVVKLG